MKLVSHTSINDLYFRNGQGPSEQEWYKMVDDGLIEGKIMGNLVYIDEDDFMSRDKFDASAANQDNETEYVKSTAVGLVS